MNTATTTTAKPVTLNDTQTAVLTHAIDHTQGKVEWFPDTIKGGARKKVIEGLFTRAMIIGSNGDWIVTDARGTTWPVPRAVFEALYEPESTADVVGDGDEGDAAEQAT